MEKNILIALDCGKVKTKYAVKTPVTKDKTASTEIVDMFDSRVDFDVSTKEDNKGRLTLVDGSIDCYVGTLDGKTTNEKTSKTDEIHKACALYAIAKNVPDGAIVDVAICLPLTEYADKEKREAFKEYILQKGEISLTVDGIDKTFTINNRLVVAEASGLLAIKPELFKDEDVAIIDIGGLNTNAIQVTNGSMVFSTRVTLSKVGSIQLHKDIKAKLNQEDIEVQDYQLDKAIQNGFVQDYNDASNTEKSKEIIENCINERLNEIFNNCSGTEWKNINTLKLIFTGGTSDVLRKGIEKRFGERAVVLPQEEARYSNVKGALKKLIQALDR